MKPLLKSASTLLTASLIASCTSSQIKTDANIQSAQSTITPLLLGQWHIEYIKGKPVMDRSPAGFIFAENGKLTGNASCNNVMSNYKQQASLLTIGAATTSKKLCAPALMAQEAQFLNALSRVNHFKMKHALLYLYNSEEKIIFRASKLSR